MAGTTPTLLGREIRHRGAFFCTIPYVLAPWSSERYLSHTPLDSKALLSVVRLIPMRLAACGIERPCLARSIIESSDMITVRCSPTVWILRLFFSTSSEKQNAIYLPQWMPFSLAVAIPFLVLTDRFRLSAFARPDCIESRITPSGVSGLASLSEKRTLTLRPWCNPGTAGNLQAPSRSCPGS